MSCAALHCHREPGCLAARGECFCTGLGVLSCYTTPVITCIPMTPVPFPALLGMARNSRDTRGCAEAEGIMVRGGTYIPLGLG